jgi:hypothetical protein
LKLRKQETTREIITKRNKQTSDLTKQTQRSKEPNEQRKKATNKQTHKPTTQGTNKAPKK